MANRQPLEAAPQSGPGMLLWHACIAYKETPPLEGSDDERLSRATGYLYLGGNEVRTENGAKRHPARCPCGFGAGLPTMEQEDAWEASTDAALCCGKGCVLELLWYVKKKVPIKPTTPGEDWAKSVNRRLAELRGEEDEYPLFKSAAPGTPSSTKTEEVSGAADGAGPQGRPESADAQPAHNARERIILRLPEGKRKGSRSGPEPGMQPSIPELEEQGQQLQSPKEEERQQQGGGEKEKSPQHLPTCNPIFTIHAIDGVCTDSNPNHGKGEPNFGERLANLEYDDFSRYVSNYKQEFKDILSFNDRDTKAGERGGDIRTLAESRGYPLSDWRIATRVVYDDIPPYVPSPLAKVHGDTLKWYIRTMEPNPVELLDGKGFREYMGEEPPTVSIFKKEADFMDNQDDFYTRTGPTSRKFFLWQGIYPKTGVQHTVRKPLLEMLGKQLQEM